MQNDQRDDRPEREQAGDDPDLEARDGVEPEAPPPEPPPAAPALDAMARQEPPLAGDETQAAAEEFETPAWPQQDRRAEAAGGEPAAGPPPSEAEAYAAAEPAEPVAAGVPAHSVPATQPGESTQCPRCGTENRPGISFCRNCGQRLVAAGAPTTVARPTAPEGTQACPRCGTHNRVGVAFCQNCGANLRGTAEGYVPPAAAPAVEPSSPVVVAEEPAAGRALLGPVVLLIGAIGIATAWLLPFALVSGSLYQAAFAADGYGITFWTAYEGISTLLEQAYFGFAAPAPLLVLLLVLLSVAGFARRAPGPLQLIGLVVALVWAVGLAVLFVLVEVLGGPGGELLDILRALSPGGIIFLLASMIVVIGVLTRVGRA